MSNLKREQLLEMFDLKHQVTFAQNDHTNIQRYVDSSVGGFALVEKIYKGPLSVLQEREFDLLFAVANKRALDQEVTSRVAGLHKFEKPNSLMAGRNIYLKWYGFDLDDWGTLLQNIPNNPMHDAHWVLELARGILQALQLMHEAGFVHSDIHGANLCLPFHDLKVGADGKWLTCTVNPDKLKLIDLGLSLKGRSERGLPPRFTLANGQGGGVLQFNPNMKPPPPYWLIDAYKEAQNGNNDAFLALDWRVDLWRLGALLTYWEGQAKDGNLTGTRALRAAVQELALDLSKCCPGSDHDRGGKLPHQRFIDQVEYAIGPAQPRQMVVGFGSAVPNWAIQSESKPAPIVAAARKPIHIEEMPLNIKPFLPEPPPPPPPPNYAGAILQGLLIVLFSMVIGGVGWVVGRVVWLKYQAADETVAAAPPNIDAAITARIVRNAIPEAPPEPKPIERLAPAFVGGPVMVVLPQVLQKGPGSQLGHEGIWASADESPTYEARLNYKLALSESEVTFALWNRCVKDNACTKPDSDSGWGEGDRPVINISWDDIHGLDVNGNPKSGKGFLNWLNHKSANDGNPNPYRLPTEAEWELAARAGSNDLWSLGKNNQAVMSDETANYNAGDTFANSIKGQFRQKTIPVKSFQTNAWGLYDMHGNVWEWVQDCYVDDAYKRRAQGGPWQASRTPVEVGNCRRVLRGGSWVSVSRSLRSSFRNHEPSDYRGDNVGFRLARTLP